MRPGAGPAPRGPMLAASLPCFSHLRLGPRAPEKGCPTRGAADETGYDCDLQFRHEIVSPVESRPTWWGLAWP